MSNELHHWAASGNLERVKQLVEDGANIDESNDAGMTALSLASKNGEFEVVVYLVEHGANVAHAIFDQFRMTALHFASGGGDLPTVKYLLEHGARITERDNEFTTALLHAAENGSLEVLQYLLSSEGGASITESDDEGNTALLLAAGWDCYPVMVQWLLEYGGTQITDTNNAGDSVWTVNLHESLRDSLVNAYTKGFYGECVPNGDVVVLTAMLRVMVLHGSPPELLARDIAPPFQRIVHDGARLRARLLAYLAQRRTLLDVHCPLLPPLQDLVHDYEEPTSTDELWATGLGAPLQRARRSRPERGQSHQRRSARLRQKLL
jgi:hypothetical protein